MKPQLASFTCEPWSASSAGKRLHVLATSSAVTALPSWWNVMPERSGKMIVTLSGCSIAVAASNRNSFVETL